MIFFVKLEYGSMKNWLENRLWNETKNDMKCDHCVTCYTKKLNKRWEWSSMVWFDESLFAHCQIKSIHDFGSREAARKNMKKVFSQLELKA